MVKVTSPYHHQDYALPSKRFLVSLFDAALLTIVTFLVLMLAMNAILPNISAFNARVTSTENHRIQMIKISEEAGLTSYSNNADGQYQTADDMTTMFKKYARQHILLSYQKEAGKWEITPQIADVSPASYTNDQFAIFYVDYVSKYNSFQGKDHDIIYLNGLSHEAYLQSVLRKNDTAHTAWITDEYLAREIANDEFLFLKAPFAQNIYLYMYENQTTGAPKVDYDYFYGLYEKNWNMATEELTNSTRFNEAYLAYEHDYVYCTHVASLVTVMSYLLGFILIFVLPTLFFKDGCGTFGHKIFHLAVVSGERHLPSPSSLVLRLLVLFFTNLPALLVASFFSGGLSSSLLFPLWNYGPSLLQILIIACILPVIDMFMVSLSNQRKSLVEWASNTLVLDTVSVPIITNEEKEKNYSRNDINLVLTDLPYIDSSTIPPDKVINEEVKE